LLYTYSTSETTKTTKTTTTTRDEHLNTGAIDGRYCAVRCGWDKVCSVNVTDIEIADEYVPNCSQLNVAAAATSVTGCSWVIGGQQTANTANFNSC